MRRLQSIREVEDVLNQVRRGAAEYCTNFFPAQAKLQDWISRGELYCDERVDAAFFLRKDRDFWRLYFSAISPAALPPALAASAAWRADPVVLDLIGKEPALAETAHLFEIAGFSVFHRLFRMARTTPAAGASLAYYPDSRVALAGPKDCQPILDLLLQSFDRHAEQIPPLYEIESAVAAGQIWVARNAGELAGLIFFETQGYSSLLRYWLTAPQHRAQGLGGALMNCFLAGQPTVRRFLLWVIASNHDAIRKYEHYGFAREGLIDYVLANDKIHP